MLVTHGASSVSHKRQLLNVRATNCGRRTTSKGLGAIRRWALWAALLSEPCIVCQALKMACLLWPVGSCRHPNSARPTNIGFFSVQRLIALVRSFHLYDGELQKGTEVGPVQSPISCHNYNRKNQTNPTKKQNKTQTKNPKQTKTKQKRAR